MITIYHNPRCKKSREGLEILEKSDKEFQVVKYLKEELSTKDIEKLLRLLDIPAEKLVRKKEKIWKENYKGKDLSDKEIVEAIQQHPKLLERPVVKTDEKAVIGRPPENINALI